MTITEIGAYTGDYNSRNLMLHELASILEKHGEKVVSSFEIDADEDGSFYYSSSSDSARRRFLANVYSTLYNTNITSSLFLLSLFQCNLMRSFFS